ncbi:MAG: YicC/YloC family endoribonuclease [Bacteroidota bacterium]
MIKSMTGYGSAELSEDKYSLKIEIKSLNSRYLDLNLKVPKEFSDKELEIKTAVAAKLVRGKLSFLVDFQPHKFEETPVEINGDLFKLFYNRYKELATEVDGHDHELFKLALQSPNVIVAREDFSSLISWETVKDVIDQAVDACDKFRVDEGSKLATSLRNNITAIREGLEKVSEMDPRRVANVRNRLEQGIADLREKTQVDENRFEQELIYYMEKFDISEEKVRLTSHLDYFMEVIDGDEANGKKLGFIAQEIGREINTIGSKANDADIQRIVVQMKDELEQIKEQVLNVM